MEQALRYLRDHDGDFPASCLFKDRVSARAATGFSAERDVPDLEHPILHPLSPGDDFELRNGRMFLVVWSRRHPTYYDLSLAGAPDKLNLTFSEVGRVNSCALGSGDQNGIEKRGLSEGAYYDVPRLVHDFEFQPENLVSGPSSTSPPAARPSSTGASSSTSVLVEQGCVLFSGFLSTLLKAWQHDRPVVMVFHVVDGETSVYYCPAPMNERIGQSITYGAVFFEMSREDGDVVAVDGAGADDDEDRGENDLPVDAKKSSWRMRFHLNTSQEGYCPGGLDRSAPVGAETYEYYHRAAREFFARVPACPDDVRRRGAEIVAVAPEVAPAEVWPGAEVPPEGHILSEKRCIIMANRAGVLREFRSQLEHVDAEHDVALVDFSTGLTVLDDENALDPTDDADKDKNPPFLGQLGPVDQLTKHPLLLLIGRDAVRVNWPVGTPALFLVDDAHRIPYEARTFSSAGRCVDNVLLILYREVEDLRTMDADAVAAEFGGMDMNPLLLVGGRAVVVAMLFEKGVGGCLCGTDKHMLSAVWERGTRRAGMWCVSLGTTRGRSEELCHSESEEDCNELEGGIMATSSWQEMTWGGIIATRWEKRGRRQVVRPTLLVIPRLSGPRIIDGCCSTRRLLTKMVLLSSKRA